MGVESGNQERGCAAGEVGVQIGGNCLGVGVAVGKTRGGGRVGGLNGFSVELGLLKTESSTIATTTVATNTTIVKMFSKSSRFILSTHP